MQNPFAPPANQKPIILSRKQLSVNALTGKPRVTRRAHPEPTLIDGPGPRERARNLKRALKLGNYPGQESDAIDQYLSATKVYEDRKARPRRDSGTPSIQTP